MSLNWYRNNPIVSKWKELGYTDTLRTAEALFGANGRSLTSDEISRVSNTVNDYLDKLVRNIKRKCKDNIENEFKKDPTYYIRIFKLKANEARVVAIAIDEAIDRRKNKLTKM